MKRILTAAQMSAADQAAISMGLPSLVLMERAALSVTEEILSGAYDTSRILVLCGPGNNGGDGAAVARLLAERGIKAEVLMFGNPQKRSEQLKIQLQVCGHYGVPYVQQYVSRRYTLIVDAIFGIGLKREIAGEMADTIEKINTECVPVIAVDISSGIDSDTGHILGCALKAKTTVTFAAGKPGHFLYPGKEYTGDLKICEIGIPVPQTPGGADFQAVEDADLLALPPRLEDGNKGTFGKLLVIAGSEDIFGAAYFTAVAALKCGIGMVKVYTHKKNRTPLATLLPEALIETYADEPDSDRLAACFEWADGVVIGPGLGRGKAAVKLVYAVQKITDMPVIYDADALNQISRELEFGDYWKAVSHPAVITPHVGEMRWLAKKSIAEIKEDPIGTALTYAREHNVVCVLKDAATVTAYPNGRCFINTSGCSALSTAGSGDVLAGITAGFLLRYANSPLPLEALAVHLHGRCGEIAARKKGKDAAIARDFIEALDARK